MDGLIAGPCEQQIPPLRFAPVGMTNKEELGMTNKKASLEREGEDAGEGDANPRGAVVEFVE